jgi:hypothetical protein
MRLIERIPIFLKLVDLDKLTEKWVLSDYEGQEITPLKELIKAYEQENDTTLQEVWENYPDMRFGQLLINLGIIYDNFRIWNLEDEEILNNQGVEEREYTLWGSVFDKQGRKRLETLYIPIKDLEASHINNILDSSKNGNIMLNTKYKRLLTAELKLKNPDNKKLIPFRLEKLAKEIAELDNQDYITLKEILTVDFNINFSAIDWIKE